MVSRSRPRLNREILDFVRAAQELQRAAPSRPLHLAITTAATMLGVSAPTELEYRSMLELAANTPRLRTRGRPRAEGMTKREAVAAVATYFESIGARPEQALSEAQRWLGVCVSRKVAKAAIKSFKAGECPSADQYYPLATFAYGTFKPDTTLPLPKQITPTTRHVRRHLPS